MPGWGINYGVAIVKCTLLHMKYAGNEDLLYSTGKFTQYYVATYMGKESKSNGYMYNY